MTMSALLFVAVVASPQIIQSASSSAGQRVRVTVSGDSVGPVAGSLVSSGSGQVEMRVTNRGTTIVLPRTRIRSFEVSRGTATRSGVVKGYLAGLGAGAIVFAATLDETSDLEAPLAAVAYIGLMPLVFAAAGGFLAGERWEPVPLSQDGSIGGTAQIRFAPGEAVRLQLPMGLRAAGVQRSTTDSLFLMDGSAARWRDVTALQVRGGTTRMRGALIGAGIGLALGVVAQASSPTPDAEAAAGGIALVTIGGGILGYRFLPPATRWVSLLVPR